MLVYDSCDFRLIYAQIMHIDELDVIDRRILAIIRGEAS